MERGTLLSDAGDYDVFLRGVGVLSLPLHSFGNKLLFWPQRLLWARAVAALAANRGREEERRFSTRLGASAQRRRQAGDRPSRPAPLRRPGPSSLPPYRRGALQPPHPPHPHPPAAPPSAQSGILEDRKGAESEEAGSSSLPARRDLRAQDWEVLPSLTSTCPLYLQPDPLAHPGSGKR